MKGKHKHVLFDRGVWLVNLRWPDGLRKRKVMPSEQKANEISLRFQAAVVDGTWQELRKKLDMDDAARAGQGIKFKELVELYLTEYVESYNKDKRNKKSRLHLVGEKLDPLPVMALQPQHVAQFIASRKCKKRNNKTINKCLLALRHLLNWAVEQHYLERNPLPDIQLLKETEWVPQRPHEWIIEEVFEKLDPRVVPFFTFLRETGCRREEALDLKHSQLDLQRREVVIWAVTKNGKSRRVPLTEKAISAIQAMPRTDKTKYVFYHPESLTRWHDCRKPWEIARKAAGHEWLRVHDLRHAFGIKLAEKGCPMHFISEVMGHATIDFTRKQYARFSPECAAQAVLKVLEGDKVTGTTLQNGNLSTFCPHDGIEGQILGLENSGKSNTIN